MLYDDIVAEVETLIESLCDDVGDAIVLNEEVESGKDGGVFSSVAEQVLSDYESCDVYSAIQRADHLALWSAHEDARDRGMFEGAKDAARDVVICALERMALDALASAVEACAEEDQAIYDTWKDVTTNMRYLAAQAVLGGVTIARASEVFNIARFSEDCEGRLESPERYDNDDARVLRAFYRIGEHPHARCVSDLFAGEVSDMLHRVSGTWSQVEVSPDVYHIWDEDGDGETPHIVRVDMDAELAIVFDPSGERFEHTIGGCHENPLRDEFTSAGWAMISVFSSDLEHIG